MSLRNAIKKYLAKTRRRKEMIEEEIERNVVDRALEVYRERGPELLEMVYEVVLNKNLRVVASWREKIIKNF